MSAPKFADSHNMVAFLAKPNKSDRFEQILDFLNANPIKYALTVNPTIYTSCIEQFWATAKVKTINGEVQLQALVDGKKVIITETSVRRDLQLEDAEGIECLPNADIFEQLSLMVFLDKQVGDMSTHDEIFVTPSHTKKVFGNMKRVGKGFSGVVTPLFPTMMVQAQEEIVNTLGSGEDKMKLKELMDLCTKLSNRVLDLETTKTAQAKEIASLKKRVTKLERKRKSKTLWMKRLFKVGRSAQVVSSEDEEQSEKVVEKVVSNAEVSAAATISTEEITLAQALAELRSAKPKVVDKGKAKMIEPEKPLKIKEQIRLDEELAFKLQAEEEEQARLAREKAEEANISWDTVQAMIEADRLLAERLQAREQEELTDEEKAILFVELLEKRKKHFAALKAQEKRNKTPTKAQKKSTMSTYLKNMASYKQSQLKNKSFAEIQKLFDKAMKRVNMFVDMDTELVKDSSMKAKAEMAQESSSKRAREELEQEIHRKGRNGYYEIMRADRSSKTYLLFSQLLKELDREDLENLWKLVKAKHANTRLEEGYERVIWVTMPRKTSDDHKNTRSYIPKMSDEYNEPLKHIFKFFENRYIHDGRVVDPRFDDLVYVRSMFSHIEFDYLLKINEQIVPCFILEFYSQYRINYDFQGQMFVEFVIQNQLFCFSLEEFGPILGIPYKGDCSFSDKCSLDDLPFSVPMGGPYQTNPLSLDNIKLLVQIKRQGVVTRIRYEQEIVVEDNRILTREITDVIKTWVDIF
ncbi:hypothetical protein Tco_0257055 [Tanacetum coccineum]